MSEQERPGGKPMHHHHRLTTPLVDVVQAAAAYRQIVRFERILFAVDPIAYAHFSLPYQQRREDDFSKIGMTYESSIGNDEEMRGQVQPTHFDSIRVTNNQPDSVRLIL